MFGIIFTIAAVLIAAYALWSYTLVPALGKSKKSYSNCTYFIISAAAAFILRIILAGVYKGHATDMSCFIGWSNMIFQDGIGSFYTSDAFHDYPPGYMYILYIIGAITKLFKIQDGAVLYAVIKLPAIICDILAGLIIFTASRKKFSDGVCAILASLYLFNPAAIVNSALWGQVDAVYTVFILLMIYLITEKKLIASYFVYAAALLIKPQAFIFAPIIIGAFIEHVFLDNFSGKKLLKHLGTGFGAIALLFALTLPFGFANVLEQYRITIMEQYPYLTVNAMNLWGALGKNWNGLNTFTTVLGYIFIAAITAYALYLFLKSKNKAKYYFTGAVLAFFTYMLSTKMHDRYAFPVMVLTLMAFVTSASKKNYLTYILVTLSQFFNTAWVLFIYEQDINKYFKSPVIIIASVINLAILAFIVYTGQKDYIAGNPATIDTVTEEQPLKHSASKLRKLKTAEKTAAAHTVTSKIETSSILPTLAKIDIIAMIIITAVYSCVALYDLGDTHAPETEYMVSEGAVTLDLGSEQNISKYKFFLGSYELNDNRNLKIKFTDADNNNVAEEVLTSGSVFHWEIKDITANARYITISTDSSDPLSVKEFALADANGQLIKPVSASNTDGNALFDEQNEVPERSNFRNGTYFDEIYHARTGYEFVHSLSVYEWTHPPLGKIFIAIGIMLFGMCPFGWRIAGTIFGIIMIPIIYIFAKKLLKKSWLTIVTCLLFTFDFMHFAQTRIATIDVYVTFFIMLMYYFMYKYYSTSFYDSSFKKGLISLALCGICMGLGIASKWTGIYAGMGLAVLFFITVFKRVREYEYAQKNPKGSTDGISHNLIIENFGPYMKKTILWCVIFFVAVPAVIYCLSYIPYLKAPDANGFQTIIENQNSMYAYHAKTVLGSEHPFSSRWYEWIIMKRPIWYYSGTVSDNVKEGISSFGNPLVWWLGVPAFFYMLYRVFKKRDKNSLFLVIAYLAQLVSWIPITRLTFIYHYFPCVPFIVLMLGYSLLCIYNEAKNKKTVMYGIFGYTALVVILFVMFYPVLSGHPCNVDYAKHFLKWFNSWVLL